MLAPVIIFVYNRPDHTNKTIESLARNYRAKETDIFIFSDNAKKKESLENVKLVRKYINRLKEMNYFRSIEIVESNINKGLANSVIQGVSSVIEKYGKAIVIEDDLISTTDFIIFMNNALDYYTNDKRIWSISGYNIPIKIPNDYKSHVYLSFRGCSWGWATWKDRWEKVDWNVVNYEQFKMDKKLRSKFNRGGRDLSDMLDLQMVGKIDSWAIRWCYAQSNLDMFTVYPVQSKIKNIGIDGSGTHIGVTSKYNIELVNTNSNTLFDTPKLDKRIINRFQNYYMSSWDYYFSKMKKKVKNLLGM